MLPQKLISSASQRALSAQLCDCDGEFVRAQVGVVASFHVLDIADSINLASPLSPCFLDAPLQRREEDSMMRRRPVRISAVVSQVLQ